MMTTLMNATTATVDATAPAAKKAKALSRQAIEQINSLGGPVLPYGVSADGLKVILENRRAADAPFRDIMLNNVPNLAE